MPTSICDVALGKREISKEKREKREIVEEEEGKERDQAIGISDRKIGEEEEDGKNSAISVLGLGS